MRMYQRRRKLTPEETARNAAERAARNAAAMHCQICGRDILANTGVIAHHGYERPYDGWQTSSCCGARELPYEASREALGQYILTLKDMLQRTKDTLASIHAEKGELALEYSERHPTDRWQKVQKSLFVSRGTFETVMAANADIFRRYGWNDFDKIKLMHVRRVEMRIEQITDDITHQTQRFNAWKLTHAYDGAKWQPVKN